MLRISSQALGQRDVGVLFLQFPTSVAEKPEPISWSKLNRGIAELPAAGELKVGLSQGRHVVLDPVGDVMVSVQVIGQLTGLSVAQIDDDTLGDDQDLVG